MAYGPLRTTRSNPGVQSLLQPQNKTIPLKKDVFQMDSLLFNLIFSNPVALLTFLVLVASLILKASFFETDQKFKW